MGSKLADLNWWIEVKRVPTGWLFAWWSSWFIRHDTKRNETTQLLSTNPLNDVAFCWRTQHHCQFTINIRFWKSHFRLRSSNSRKVDRFIQVAARNWTHERLWQLKNYVPDDSEAPDSFRPQSRVSDHASLSIWQANWMDSRVATGQFIHTFIHCLLSWFSFWSSPRFILRWFASGVGWLVPKWNCSPPLVSSYFAFLVSHILVCI